MDGESEVQNDGLLDIEQQSDFLVTENLLRQSIRLTSFIVDGPTRQDQDNWCRKALSQLHRMLRALRQVFRVRKANCKCQRWDSDFDQISSQSVAAIRNFRRGDKPSNALTVYVGTTIQKYAGMVMEDLELGHAWDIGCHNMCTCCRTSVLKGMQKSIIEQLRVLESAAIPW